MNVFEQYESEVRSYCRNYPTVFEYAKDDILTDENGRRYIDFFCGAGAVNYGHNNDYIKEKLIRYLQEDKILHSLDMYATAKRSFIEYFEEAILAPRGLDYKLQFVGPTGTNAVEAALKLARKYTGRSGIFALMGAFHGMTMGSLSLTTDADSRTGAGVALHDVTHIPAPYMFPALDTIEYIETILCDDHSGIAKPAAIVIETVQADGGVYPLDIKWLQRLRALCDKYEILLVVDDVQVGCGRTGTFFSFERAGIVPDIVTLSKSIGGYGLPFAMVMLKPQLDVWAPGEHTGTFRGNQLAFVSAKAGLEYMLEHDIEAETRRKGAIVDQYLHREILPLDERLQVRGIGLMWGIDFARIPGASKEMITACFERGLVIERAGRGNDVLKIMPPLIISDDNLQKGLEIVKEALQAVLAAHPAQ
ncbi:diaminobutyrate--2-oxoglutarate transaminase [Neobittarella massiliensis]|uniref:Diaminobutyrate--2-oxoglutarate transaminase n=1 Tax=uncultured Anaerotruncus sp. TaxID=905011 RepID=A0A1C6IVW5_9FIRM|nr:diaminobutyrate--2-oxoglutarate transaminase [Neobittarella massiliensis]SCJ73949.1 Diaminobutyrate--2-oxoglutarate transaminase [uncultured Anaerotruncus sp.]